MNAEKPDMLHHRALYHTTGPASGAAVGCYWTSVDICENLRYATTKHESTYVNYFRKGEEVKCQDDSI